MKNISRGGAYLECNGEACFMPEQVGQFRFRSLTPDSEQVGAILLAAKAIVRRVEPGSAGSSTVGVAIQFLSGPLISYS